MFATKYNPVSFRQPYLAHLRLISSATTRRQPKLKKVVVDKVETSRGRLSITKIGPAKDPKIQRKSKLETVFPTSHIKGLNFPKDQHEAYHKDLEERRASVGLFSGVTHSDVWLKRFVLSPLCCLVYSGLVSSWASSILLSRGGASSHLFSAIISNTAQESIRCRAIGRSRFRGQTTINGAKRLCSDPKRNQNHATTNQYAQHKLRALPDIF